MPWVKVSNSNRPVVGDKVTVRWHDGDRECKVLVAPLRADKKKLWAVETQNGGKLDVGMRQMSQLWRKEE